jgi:hypothetical protein
VHRPTLWQFNCEWSSHGILSRFFVNRFMCTNSVNNHIFVVASFVPNDTTLFATDSQPRRVQLGYLTIVDLSSTCMQGLPYQMHPHRVRVTFDDELLFLAPIAILYSPHVRCMLVWSIYMQHISLLELNACAGKLPNVWPFESPTPSLTGDFDSVHDAS